MEARELKEILDTFLREFREALSGHVRDMKDALEPTDAQDAEGAMLLSVVNDIARDVGNVLTVLEDRNGL